MTYFNFTSLTFWSGVALILQGLVSIVPAIIGGGEFDTAALQRLSEGLGLIGLRRAIARAVAEHDERGEDGR